MFPLEMPFFFVEYKIPILARFLNRGMKWLYLPSFFCLVAICFSIYILNEEGGVDALFCLLLVWTLLSSKHLLRFFIQRL